MSQVFANPDELEKFAQALAVYLESITESTNTLNASFVGLGDSWQDAQRNRFEETFNELLQSLASFQTVASEQIPYLHALVQRLRDYATT